MSKLTCQAQRGLTDGFLLFRVSFMCTVHYFISFLYLDLYVLGNGTSIRGVSCHPNTNVSCSTSDLMVMLGQLNIFLKGLSVLFVADLRRCFFVDCIVTYIYVLCLSLLCCPVCSMQPYLLVLLCRPFFKVVELLLVYLYVLRGHLLGKG